MAGGLDGSGRDDGPALVRDSIQHGFEALDADGPEPASRAGEELQYSLPADAPQGFYRVLGARTAALAGTAEGGAEVFGYGAAFEAALAKIGQISPQAFAERFASGAAYLPGLSWDPTTARFWDQFDADPRVVNVGKTPGTVGYRSSDYRLNSREREAFRRNGFVVSERLGALGGGSISYGTSMGNVYYRPMQILSGMAFLTSTTWRRRGR